MKKKNIIYSILLSTILLTTGATCNKTLSDLWGGNSMNLEFSDIAKVINMVINWLVSAAAVLAVLFLIIGGVQYIFSLGNTEASEKAKKSIFEALTGLIIIMVAYLVIKFIAGLILKENVF